MPEGVRGGGLVTMVAKVDGPEELLLGFLEEEC
jgi:hypothetical protein